MQRKVFMQRCQMSCSNEIIVRLFVLYAEPYGGERSSEQNKIKLKKKNSELDALAPNSDKYLCVILLPICHSKCFTSN